MRAILQELVYDSPVGGAVWPFDREYIRPPHFHGQVECLLILNGTATVHLGTRSEALHAGQLCWILPCLPHVMSGFSPDFDMWVVQLEPATIASSWRTNEGGLAFPATCAFDAVALLGERLAGRPVVEMGMDVSRRMSELATEAWNAPLAANARISLRALCDLALQSTLPSLNQRREASLIDTASCLLLATPTMNRRSLARVLGVSEGFLSRCFGRDLEVSFVEHRARARLAHFLAVLQTGGQNLLEAALAAGFGSYSQFHRVFTRVSGVRPRDYLESGRYRLQLLVAGDADRPQSAPMRMLPKQRRQRARLDAPPNQQPG